MGNNLRAVLLKVLVVTIILFTGSSINMITSANTSDFKVENGVLKQYLGSEKEIVIPKGVKTIGVGVFKNSTIEKVTIPDSVNIIGDEAFQNCGKLTEIIIPDSVYGLGQSTFQGCSSLYRAELSSNLYVGISAFADCTSLKEVIIPNGVSNIESYAFKNCTELEMIDLPDSISHIGGGCFENCTSLETILFPSMETFIGSNAFKNTLWMDNYDGDYVIVNHTIILYRGYETNITIPKNITVIGDEAFADCTFITNVNIPKGVELIGNSAFYNCTGLTEIVVPDSVTKIGAYAFFACSNLAKITVPKDVEISRDSLSETKWMMDYPEDFIILNGNLLGYQGIDSKVVIPDYVTTICHGAFTENDIVTEITVPESVTKLSYAAFLKCKNLQKILITNKTINIEYEAFLDCSNLKLYSVTGGTAEEYAKRNKVQFVSYGLNKTSVTIYLGGDDTTLKMKGIDGTVQWQSENVTIANVSENGTVTAVKTGTTKVNAIVNDITMSCKITVKEPYISKKTLTIKPGSTSRLNVVGISTGLNWSSSNKSVASVSSNGVITAKKAGTASITATIGGKKYSCKVTVK